MSLGLRMEEENRRLEERRVWLKYLSQNVKPGKIVEFGCGSGSVLEILSDDFPDSVIVGMDKSMERLAGVREKNLKNVFPVEANIIQNIFPDSIFDTALFVGSLHEVYSYLGEEAVQGAFRIAHSVLKSHGVLIIQDFLKPSPRSVRIVFKNEGTRRAFFRFVDEFRPREVRFEKIEDGLILDIADAVEFISKYRSPSEEDWNEEMGETHFFFTEEEYREAAQGAGFIIKSLRKLPRSEIRWRETRKDMKFEFEPEYSWIQLVLMKKQS